jgi:hypothetical protein
MPFKREQKEERPAPKKPMLPAVRPASQLNLSKDVIAQLAEEARNEQAKERPTMSRLSTRGGILSYQDTAMPGNKINAVILFSAYINTYYVTDFDPDVPANPYCFALGTDDDMVPHEVVPDKQSETCATCEHHAWGSDPKGGRGKACKEKRRLIVIHEDEIMDLSKAEMAVLELPVTSVRNWSSYVNGLAASTGLPPYAIVTEISVVPDRKSQFKIEFTPLHAIEDGEIILALKKKRAEAERLALVPFDPYQEPEAKPVPQPKKKAKF